LNEKARIKLILDTTKKQHGTNYKTTNKLPQSQSAKQNKLIEYQI